MRRHNRCVKILPMPMTNIEIKKNNNENGVGLVRRFSRKMIESGIIIKVKTNRYNVRPMSKVSEKKMKLKKLIRRTEVEKLKKLGKM